MVPDSETAFVRNHRWSGGAPSVRWPKALGLTIPQSLLKRADEVNL
jgi:hypothetical protein